MKAARITFSLSFLLFATSSVLAQKVNVDWDKATNFTGYKTYIWAKGTPAQNPMMGDRIVKDVDAALAAKGLRKVDTVEGADLVVLYHAARDTETQLNTID